MKNSKRLKRKAEDTEPKSFSVTVSGGKVGNISQDTAENMDKRENTTTNHFGERKQSEENKGQEAESDNKKFGFEKVGGIEGNLLNQNLLN